MKKDKQVLALHKKYPFRLRRVRDWGMGGERVELQGWGEASPITVDLRHGPEIARWLDQARHEIATLEEQIRQQQAKVDEQVLGADDQAFGAEDQKARRKSRWRRIRKAAKKTVKRLMLDRTAIGLASGPTEAGAEALANPSRKDAGPGSGSDVWWAVEQCNARRPVLAIMGPAIGAELMECLKARQIDTVLLSPGCGHGSPCGERCAQLARPAAGTFLRWLSEEEPSTLRKYGTIVLDATASGLDAILDALRHRLSPSQILLCYGAAALNSMPAPDGQVAESPDGRFRAYRNIPRLLENFLAAPTVVRQIDWPKISIVSVSYNQAEYLDECLDSVLTQNYPACEYIVVDGASTDGSIDILERYRKYITRLIIEPDHGQSDALNKGFRHTTGRFLNWINSDDALEPEALFRVADGFLSYPVDLVAGGCRRVKIARDQLLFTQHSAIPFATPTRLNPLDLLNFSDSWQRADFFFQPEVFFSREIWNKAGAFLRDDLYYAMDYELWLRMAMAGADILHIHDVIGCSREHPEQKTTAARPYLPQLLQIFRDYEHLFVELQSLAQAEPAFS